MVVFFSLFPGGQHYRLNALKHLNSVVLEGYKPFTSHLFNESVSNDDDSKTLTGLAFAIEHRRDLPKAATTTTGGFNFSPNLANLAASAPTTQQGGFNFAAASSSSSSSGAFRTEQNVATSSNNAFGANYNALGTTNNSGAFGGANNAFGATNNVAATNNNAFGAATNNTSAFGANNLGAVLNAFGGNSNNSAFGGNNTQTTGGGFGGFGSAPSSFGSAAPSVSRSRSGRTTRRRVIRRPVGGVGSFR